MLDNEKNRLKVLSASKLSYSHSRNYKGNGYKLSAQQFHLGSFGWKSNSYDWSTVLKATINQSQVTLVRPNDPNKSLRRKLVPISLIVSAIGNLDERSKPRENASLLACLSRVYFSRHPPNEEVARRLPKVVSEVKRNKVNETWRTEGKAPRNQPLWCPPFLATLR